MRRRTRRLVATIAVGLAVAAAGCSSDDGDVASQGADNDQAGAADVAVGGEEDATGAAAPAAQGDGADDSAGSDEAGSGDDVPNAADNLKIIRTATITLSSDDPDDTASQVRERAAAAGGYVAGSDLHRNDLGLLAGTITIRVPAAHFDTLRTDVSETAASVVGETSSTEDVTDRLRDIDANLRNLGALEQELLALLSDARETGDTDEVLGVFDRLSEVRGEIERIEATKAGLDDRVSLSTLTVEIQPSRTLVAQADQIPEKDRPLPWSPTNQAESAWDVTISAVQGFVNLLIWIVVTLLPVLLVWASPFVVIVVVWRWWRRRRSRPNDPGDAQPDATMGDAQPDATSGDAHQGTPSAQSHRRGGGDPPPAPAMAGSGDSVGADEVAPRPTAGGTGSAGVGSDEAGPDGADEVTGP